MEQSYVACNAAGLDRLRILVQQVSDDELGREIAGGWTVYPRRPDHLPRREEELPALSLEERLIALARLADQDIVDASLGDHDPHLILTFASGSVFFLNGYHDAYECWNLAMVDDRGRARGGEHHD